MVKWCFFVSVFFFFNLTYLAVNHDFYFNVFFNNGVTSITRPPSYYGAPMHILVAQDKTW